MKTPPIHNISATEHLGAVLTALDRTEGLPWCLSGKESDCQCRRRKRCGFNPWVRQIPWRILAWRIPWTEEPGGLQITGTKKSQSWVNTHTCHARLYWPSRTEVFRSKQPVTLEGMENRNYHCEKCVSSLKYTQLWPVFSFSGLVLKIEMSILKRVNNRYFGHTPSKWCDIASTLKCWIIFLALKNILVRVLGKRSFY